MKENFEDSGQLVKSLGKELLDKYKEINLLYNIGEKISADNSIEEIGGIVLKETGRILRFDYAYFLLLEIQADNLNFKEISSIRKNCGYKNISDIFGEIKKINEKVYVSGKGVIENKTASGGNKGYSLMAAPLKTDQNQKIIGLTVLCSFDEEDYSAQNLNFLSAVSSYAANLIELIRLYEYEKETVKNLKAKNTELKNTKNTLIAENANLKKNLKENYSAENIIGSSDACKLLTGYIEKIAGLYSSVLITGETGTGKELVAKAVHYSAGRPDKPFIAVNCSAVPESIFESELFGIEKGVATGVIHRKGKLPEADGGTLFLDEIGDLPLTQQAKLLRAIEEKEVLPLGGKTPIKLDVRFIAATNKDLKKEVSNGNFREDLYYRLNVLHIVVPPLRERREDIPLLIKHFISVYSSKLNKGDIKISDEAADILKNYGYPGNIRELKNEIERIISLIDSPEITVKNISEHIINNVVESYKTKPENNGSAVVISRNQKLFRCNGDNSGAMNLKTYNIGESEKELIKAALSSSSGNKSAAAKKLGISREGLRIKIKKLGLS